MLLHLGTIPFTSVGDLAQVFAETDNRLFAAVVLFVAPPLVVDVDRVVGVDIEVGQQLDTLDGIAVETGLLGGALFFRLRGGPRVLLTSHGRRGDADEHETHKEDI